MKLGNIVSFFTGDLSGLKRSIVEAERDAKAGGLLIEAAFNDPLKGLGATLGENFRKGIAAAAAKAEGEARQAGAGIEAALTNPIKRANDAAAKVSRQGGEQVGDAFVQGLAGPLGGVASFVQNALAFATGGLLQSAIEGVIGAISDGIGSLGSFFVQSNQSVADLQATLGTTREEAERLRNVARDVFATGLTKDIGLAADMVGRVRQQLGAMADQELANVTIRAGRLADTFKVDFNQVIDAVRSVKENFPGVTEVQALDMITAGFQRGLDRSGDFLDSIREYSNQFGKGNASAQQFFGIMESGLAGGVNGTDRIADAFKEFNLRILDGSKKTKDALDALKLTNLLADLNQGKITAADALGSIIERLQEVDETTRRQLGTDLIGTQFEDLGFDVQAFAGIVGDSFADVEGATDQLASKYESFGALWQSLKNTALVSLDPIGQKLLGIASDVMPTVQRALSWIGERLPALIAIGEQAVGRLVAAGEKIWQAFGPVLQNVGEVLSGVGQMMAQVASVAFSWGEGLVAEYANGIAAGVGWVADALQAIADTIMYWLMPHSPPKLLPYIDKWGHELARIYMAGWSDPSLFDSVEQFGKTLGTALENLADSGQAGGDVPSLLLRSRAAFADLLQELEVTGNVSEATFKRLRDAAGGGADVAERLAHSYVQAAQASKQLRDAQQSLLDTNGELEAAQAQLLAAQERGDSGGIGAAQNAIAAAKAQKQAAQQRVADAEKAKKDATDQIKQEAQVQDFQREQLDLLRQIAQAQEAQSEAAAKAALDKKKGLSDEEKAAKAAQEAQERYNFNLLDTQGKIDHLRTKQGQYNQSQKEYWEIADQIRQLEGQKLREEDAAAKELERIAKQQESEQEKELARAKAIEQAQWDYAYLVADTATKLQMQRERLAGLTEGSVDYYKTLGDIYQLEQQLNRERELADKKGAGRAGGAGGAGAAGIGGFKPPTITPPQVNVPTAPSVNAGAMQRDNAPLAIMGNLEQTVSPLTTALQTLQTKLGEVGSAIQTFTAGPVAFVVGAFNGWKDSLVTYFLPALGNLWDSFQRGAENFDGVGERFSSAMGVILPLITMILKPLGDLAFLIGGAIVTALGDTLPGLFFALSGVIQGFLTVVEGIGNVIGGVINFVVALFNGDWKGAWDAAGQIVMGLVQLVTGLIGGLVQGVLGLVGSVVAGVIGFFTHLYDVLVGNSIIPDLVTEALGFFTQLKDDAIQFVKDLVNDVVQRFTTFKDDTLRTIGNFVTESLTKFENFKKDVLKTVNDLASEMYDSGVATISNFWDGMKKKWEELWKWAKERAQQIKDLLPGSEPKDRTSPLYGLGKSGEALIGNIQAGIDKAGALRIPDVDMPNVNGIAGGLAGAFAGDTFNLTINNPVVRDDQDIEVLGKKVAKVVAREMHEIRRREPR